MNASSYLKVFDSIEIRGHKITHKSGIGLGFKSRPVVEYYLENYLNLFQRYSNHACQSYVHTPHHTTDKKLMKKFSNQSPFSNNNNNDNQSLICAHIYIRPTAQKQENSVHVIRNTTHRPSMQASYTACRVPLNKENQPWRRKLQPGSQYHFLVSTR